MVTHHGRSFSANDTSSLLFYQLLDHVIYKPPWAIPTSGNKFDRDLGNGLAIERQDDHVLRRFPALDCCVRVDDRLERGHVATSLDSRKRNEKASAIAVVQSGPTRDDMWCWQSCAGKVKCTADEHQATSKGCPGRSQDGRSPEYDLSAWTAKRDWYQSGRLPTIGTRYGCTHELRLRDRQRTDIIQRLYLPRKRSLLAYRTTVRKNLSTPPARELCSYHSRRTLRIISHNQPNLWRVQVIKMCSSHTDAALARTVSQPDRVTMPPLGPIIHIFKGFHQPVSGRCLAAAIMGPSRWAWVAARDPNT